ncbi:MAG: 60S ribosomal protein L2A [Watsoniomyces obsoletus]|nr:MAG: 60S ribosomal protein L2A [Watsoniomyces obsoletus]
MEGKTSSIEQSWQDAQGVEKQLRAKLGEKDLSLEEIDSLLNTYRAISEGILFRDLDFATSKNVEARLWDAHSKINGRFRKLLAQFQHADAKRKVVEKRKLMKRYLEFIKSSQRFYRGYIQRLASQFGGIPELERVAHQFKLENRRTHQRKEGSEQLRRQVLVSCHQTLIRLGDLSRYRETELTVKDRNWGPAVGYYELACVILPASGAAHNQLAVIGLVDGNHLRATYHLYRAIAAEEPHPTAKGNLEIEFKKIVGAWRKGELFSASGRDGNSSKALSAWFVLLHARCYNGEIFSGHEELEGEVLGRLGVEVKGPLSEQTLVRFILINIAAEYFAGIRVKEQSDSTECYQAFFFFLRLNLKTFIVLLETLRGDLHSRRERGSSTPSSMALLTPVVRRLLPGLRNYSSWLGSNVALLVAGIGDETVQRQVKELWRTYATTLTLIAAAFPTNELPSVDYLLDEDVDTLGFSPFDSEQARRRYVIDGNGQKTKPRWEEPGVRRLDANREMLARVREFLTDGLSLVVGKSIPIVLGDDGTFSYESGEAVSVDRVAGEIAVSIDKSTNGHDVTMSGGTEEKNEDDTAVQHDHEQVASVPQPPDTSMELDLDNETMDVSEPAAQEAMAIAMNHMVDSLVGPDSPEDDPDESFPTSIPEPSMVTSGGDETSYDEPGVLTAAHLVQIVRGYNSSGSSLNPTRRASQVSPVVSVNHRTNTVSSTPRPQSTSVLIPSIWNTPFAPQPNDLSLSLSASSRSSPRTSRPGSGNIARMGPAATIIQPPIGTSSSMTSAARSGSGNGPLGSFHSSSMIQDASWLHQYPSQQQQSTTSSIGGVGSAAAATATPGVISSFSNSSMQRPIVNNPSNLFSIYGNGSATRTGPGVGMSSQTVGGGTGGSHYYPTPTPMPTTHRRQGSSSLRENTVYAGDSAYDALMATEELWGGWAAGGGGGGSSSGMTPAAPAGSRPLQNGSNGIGIGNGNGGTTVTRSIKSTTENQNGWPTTTTTMGRNGVRNSMAWGLGMKLEGQTPPGGQRG